mgnify:CR=1 FL=1
MRYYQAQTQPYVSSYVGNKYNSDLYLKAGAMLEDRLNQAEAANAKFQETGELTPGYFTSISGEADEINNKIRQAKQRASEAALAGKTNELKDALLQGQALYNTPIARRVQQDFENTNKYITPEVVKREGREGEAFLIRGPKDPNAIRNTANIPAEWYGLYDNKLSPQSLNYLKNFQADVDNELRTAQVPQKNPITGEMEMVAVTNSSQYQDYRRQAFGERLNEKIDAMNPDLSNPGEDFSGVFFEKEKGYLGLDSTPGSGGDPNHPEWSEMQVKAKERILDYGKLLFHEVGKTVDKTTGFDGGNDTPAKQNVPYQPFPAMTGQSENLPLEKAYTDTKGEAILPVDYHTLNKAEEALDPKNTWAKVISETYGVNITPKDYDVLASTDPNSPFDPQIISTITGQEVTPDFIAGLANQMETSMTEQNNIANVKAAADVYVEQLYPSVLENPPQEDILKAETKRQEILLNKSGWTDRGTGIINPELREACKQEIAEKKKKFLNQGGKEKDWIPITNEIQRKYVKLNADEAYRTSLENSPGVYGQAFKARNEFIKEIYKEEDNQRPTILIDQFGKFKDPNIESVGTNIKDEVMGNLHNYVDGMIYDRNGKVLNSTEILKTDSKTGKTLLQQELIPTNIVEDAPNNRMYLKVNQVDADTKEFIPYYIDVTQQVIAATNNGQMDPSYLENFNLKNAFWKEIKDVPNNSEKSLGDVAIRLKLGFGDDVNSYSAFKDVMDKVKIKKVGKDSYIFDDGVHAKETIGLGKLLETITKLEHLSKRTQTGGSGVGESSSLQFLE